MTLLGSTECITCQTRLCHSYCLELKCLLALCESWEIFTLKLFGSYSFPDLAESLHFKCNFWDLFICHSFFSIIPVTTSLFNENNGFSLEWIFTFLMIIWLINLSKINDGAPGLIKRNLNLTRLKIFSFFVHHLSVY